MHKLSFACMKTKFSPVGDIILDCQCQRFCPFSPVDAGKNLVVSKIFCNFVSKIKNDTWG